MAGLEVEDIRFAGLPLPEHDDHGFKVSGIAWDHEKIVVAEIREVNPHPNADRLTLCESVRWQQEHHIVLTGAPNLYPLQGPGQAAQNRSRWPMPKKARPSTTVTPMGWC